MAAGGKPWLHQIVVMVRSLGGSKVTWLLSPTPKPFFPSVIVLIYFLFYYIISLSLVDFMSTKLLIINNSLKPLTVLGLSRYSTKRLHVYNFSIDSFYDQNVQKIYIFKSLNQLKWFVKLQPCDDIHQYLSKCPNEECYPTIWELHILANFFSFNSHSEGLKRVKGICSTTANDEYQRCSQFQHYNAQLIWMNGNIKCSIQRFLVISNENNNLKSDIDRMLGNLIISTYPNQSKASMETISSTVETYSLTTENYDLLAALWSALFLSDWYVDQCNAVKLLNKHQQLQHHVERRIPLISKYLLANHKIGDYQRLIEILLKFNMNKLTGQLLRALFDYYYKVGNERGCTAVVNCCDTLNYKLTSDQIFKFQCLKNIKGKKSLQNITNIISKAKPKFKF